MKNESPISRAKSEAINPPLACGAREVGGPMRRLNAAIVGCGWVADWHTRDGLARIPELYSVAACCDVNAERSKEFANRYGIPNALTDFDDLLKRSDIDV